MLLEQVYSEEDDTEHIRWLIECFKDPRYIRIEGRPLLAVYRAQYLPEAKRTVELWRAECERAGVERPWLVQFETEEQLSDPALLGFDASAEFVPHRLAATVPSVPFLFGPEKSHTMYEYEVVASAYLNRPPVEWQRYPCVATGWDNTPRRQAGEALILHNSTPDAYGRWLAEAASRQMHSSGSSGIVFVNAWNEWAEGAHLEPDEHWGRAYLEVTRDVLGELTGAPAQIPERIEITHPKPIASEDLYHDLYAQFTLLQQSASGLLCVCGPPHRRAEEALRIEGLRGRTRRPAPSPTTTSGSSSSCGSKRKGSGSWSPRAPRPSRSGCPIRAGCTGSQNAKSTRKTARQGKSARASGRPRTKMSRKPAGAPMTVSRKPMRREAAG